MTLCGAGPREVASSGRVWWRRVGRKFPDAASPIRSERSAGS